MDSSTKARENRVRRMAERRGYELSRSRRRDPGAIDYGLYSLVPAGRTHRRYVLTLDEAEQRIIAAGRDHA